MSKIFNKTYDKLDSVYEYIKNHIEKNGFAPSIREIGYGLKIKSASLVKYYVDILEQAGRITRSNTSRRVITLSESQPLFSSEHKELINFDGKIFMSPVVGQVTAGLPILATQNISDYYPLPSDEFSQENTFMLKVIGDSMINAGIYNGDTVIVDKLKSPINNDIVVALWDDCATVKRLRFKNKNTIILHPENELYEDITISDNDTFKILGIVVGLIRKF